jgi:hypothetical protein
MKLQRIAALTKKELKKTIREPAVLFVISCFQLSSSSLLELLSVELAVAKQLPTILA